MFIDWASHLHLLEHDAQAHILKDFALNVKKILVSQVATFLQEPKIATLVLSSPSHVTWAMETVGEGFNLPIEEEDSIAKAITLYKTWALEPTKRPNAINDNPQFFMQRILGHLSLMFQPRTNTKEGVDKHAAFCSTVLDIYVEIGRTVGSKLSVETWELFLKLLISLTDLLLREDLPGTQELQRKLCSQLLRVLFELWLLSRTRNPTLWAALKERVRGWTHHTALITTWKSICIALTKRSTSILYGKSEGTDCVIISTDHDSIQKINLEDEYVFYSWHRMLNLIGNPNESISLPYNFFDFLSGVEILVNQYLKIGMSSSQENSRYLPPSGNTILHIFGTWLFDAIHLNRKGFEEGTALATKILVTTVSQKQSTPFLPVYSSSFFSSLRHALTQEERVLITAISSSTALFTLEVSGIRCLIPSFVEAIQRICEGRAKLGNNVLPEEQVRRSCYEILSSLICLPNHFSTTKFFVQGESQSATTLETYESLREPFSSILLTALDRETLPANIESLLSLIFTWQFETISCGRTDFIKKSLKAILQKVKSKAWIPNVTLRALRSLGEMAVHYENMGSKRAIQATSLVDTLCRIITQIGNPAVAPHDEISAACYYTITKWIIAKDQWLLDIHETRQTLLSVIVNSLCCKQEPTSEAEKEQASKGTKRGKDKKKDEKLLDKPIAETSEVIKKAARYTLQVLVNVLGNFPSASGPASFSSLATEEDVLRQMISQPNSEVTIENSVQYVRYFMTEDNVIICVIDRRDFDPDGKPCVCVILRDPFGRYTWDTKLSFLPLNPPEPTAESGEETPPSSAPTTPLCDSNGEEIVVSTPFERSSKDFNPETDLSNVMDFLTKKTSPPVDAIQSITQQVQEETKILQSKKYHLDVNIRIHAPVVQRMEDECRVKESRMFLSQIGLLSLENRDKLYPLAMNSTLFSLLHQLDQQAERTCIRVGVLYIRKGQSESEWFGNEHGDMDYQQFVATLGWGIEITRHNGFTGTLDLTGNTSGSLAPYYSDFDTEIIFQTCTLMPNSSTYPDHGHKRKQATNGSCLVAWVEDLTGFQPSLIWKKLRHSALIVTITPNENGLYLIRLFSKTPEHSFGPLIDGMVLRKEVIAPLVRATAVNAWQIYENSNNIIPAQPRSDTIQKIFNSCKLVDNLEEFYVPLFTDIVIQESSAFTSSLKKSLRSPRHRKPTKARASANRPASHIEEVSESEGDESKRERSRRKKKRPKTTI